MEDGANRDGKKSGWPFCYKPMSRAVARGAETKGRWVRREVVFAINNSGVLIFVAKPINRVRAQHCCRCKQVRFEP